MSGPCGKKARIQEGQKGIYGKSIDVTYYEKFIMIGEKITPAQNSYLMFSLI